VIVGVSASLVLALLSYVRVSTSGVAYRKPEIWSSQSTLLVSRPGFPEGRSAGGAVGLDLGFQHATTLAQTYAAFVESDQVAALLARRGLVERDSLRTGSRPVTASAVFSTANGSPTPLMTISGSATTPAKAIMLTVGATKAFIDTLEGQQARADIPRSNRVRIEVLRRFSEPTLSQPRSKSMSIVILMAGLSATFAAVLVRDRDSRRGAASARVPDRAMPIDAARRQDSEDSVAPNRSLSGTTLGGGVSTEHSTTPRLAALNSETPDARDQRRGPPGKRSLGSPPPDGEHERRVSQS
jgi:hypothetical protein